MTTWLNSIDNVKLRESIQQLITAYPDSLHVVQNLINYYNDKLASVNSQDEETKREHKKRKIEASPVAGEQQKTAIINDISFQLPARKKFNLVFTSSRQLLLVNTKTEETDYIFDLNTIQQVCCVPSPAPTKGGYTFILFSSQMQVDPIVFSVQPKGDMLIQRPLSSTPSTTVTEEKEKAITQLLSEHGGLQVQLSSKQVYLSTVVSATTGKRPEEDRFYANVYLKNKEGCLYFLPHGILFGFKKPVYYFPLNVLASTFYSGITQHTFNLTLVLHKGKGPLGSLFNNKEEEEGGAILEFSMIEQSEFGGIDEYIKKMGINDKSMSEENMAPETKARKNNSAQQQQEEGNDLSATSTTNHDEDDDEENDDDFQPSDNDDEPLEYDSDAGSSQEEEEEEDDDDDDDEDEDEEMMDEDDNSIENNENTRRPEMEEGEDEIDDSREDDMTAEQDITKTDNESDEEEELGATEYDAEEDEEEGLDDAESESLGSGSEDDIDEDMREAKTRTIIPEDAKDELEDSD